MPTKITTTQARQIGKKLGIDFDQSECKYDLSEFTMGMNVELEHKGVAGGDMLTTGRIALDHLKEIPDYYTRLKAMEADVKKAPVAFINAIKNEPCPKCGNTEENQLMIEGSKARYICRSCGKHYEKHVSLHELQKSTKDIKEEAEPMKPKTKLQTKVLGNIEHFLEKNNSSLENNISMGGTVLVNAKSADCIGSHNMNINSLVNAASKMNKSVLVSNFIKEYRNVVALNNSLPENRIDATYKLAMDISSSNELKKSCGAACDGSCNREGMRENGVCRERVERIDAGHRDGISLSHPTCDTVAEKLLYIDNVATKLHETGQYPMLDKIAELACTKCKHCSLDDNGIMNVQSFEKHMICKGKLFDKSKNYWTLMVHAIKHGVSALTDEELILLREFIYSRM